MQYHGPYVFMRKTGEISDLNNDRQNKNLGRLLEKLTWIWLTKTKYWVESFLRLESILLYTSSDSDFRISIHIQIVNRNNWDFFKNTESSLSRRYLPFVLKEPYPMDGPRHHAKPSFHRRHIPKRKPANQLRKICQMINTILTNDPNLATISHDIDHCHRHIKMPKIHTIIRSAPAESRHCLWRYCFCYSSLCSHASHSWFYCHISVVPPLLTSMHRILFYNTSAITITICEPLIPIDVR